MARSSGWFWSLALVLVVGCEDPESPADGGLLADATVNDLGVDGGASDTGTRDLGSTDRGFADQGVATDADPTDTDPVDFGPADAEPPDQGGTDAGVACPIGWDDTTFAELRVTADDDRRVVLNEVVYDELSPSRTWGTITTVTVPIYRHPWRPNVLAVRAENYFRIDGRDRGLLLQVALTGTAAPPLVTDQRWRIATATAADWESVAFDDSGWGTPVEQIQHPGGPWGAVFGVSGAAWIWPYDSVVPAAAKPVTERMLARRRFYLGLNGEFLDAPGACP